VLISGRRQFLFVHIQKTAGSTLRQVLHERIPDLRPFLGTHDTALDARRALGDAAHGEHMTAAFVRNPWDRLVSWYSMIMQARASGAWWRRHAHRPVPRLWSYVYANADTFEDFLRHCTAEIDDVDGRKSFCRNQVDYLSDEGGRPIVQFVGRYETLDEDTARLFERLGLRGVRLPRVNASRHRHYSAYYSDALADLVRERYARDIAAFGYEFVRREPPPRRGFGSTFASHLRRPGPLPRATT
jgi:hypothetical protein